MGCKWINLNFQIGCLHEGTVYQITVSYMVWVVIEVKISVLLGWSAILGFYDISAVEYEGRTFRHSADNHSTNITASPGCNNLFFLKVSGEEGGNLYKMKDKQGTVRKRVGGNVSEGYVLGENAGKITWNIQVYQYFEMTPRQKKKHLYVRRDVNSLNIVNKAETN